MARDVHQMRAVGDDLDALLDQPVDDAADRLLVAGNGARGIDHAVAARSVDLADAGPRRCARAPRAARPGCRCRAPRPCRRQIAIGIHRPEILHAVEIAGLARDLRRCAPWRGRPRRPRGPAARAASATARRRADIRGEGRDRDAAPAPFLISSASVLATSASEGERPSRTALVESPTSARQPSSPSARSFFSSVASPRIGVGSIFQSPVCSTLPSGVRMMSAFDSGIECAMVTSSTSNGPTSKRLPSRTMVTGISGAPGSLARLAASSAAVKAWRRPAPCSCGHRSSSAPKWSSCACVSTMPARFLRSSIRIADVGQDQIDARQMLFGGERHAEIDREPLAARVGGRGRRSTGSCRSRRRRRAARTPVPASGAAIVMRLRQSPKHFTGGDSRVTAVRHRCSTSVPPRPGLRNGPESRVPAAARGCPRPSAGGAREPVAADRCETLAAAATAPAGAASRRRSAANNVVRRDLRAGGREIGRGIGRVGRMRGAIDADADRDCERRLAFALDQDAGHFLAAEQQDRSAISAPAPGASGGAQSRDRVMQPPAPATNESCGACAGADGSVSSSVA